MSQPSPTYEPRRAAHGALSRVVIDFETFCAEADRARDGRGLPRFIGQAAFARSATACHAEVLAEAGIPGVPAVRDARGWLRAFSVR